MSGPDEMKGAAHTPDPADDDDSEWMTMFSTLDDREIDGLLSGQPTANAELAPLVEVVATLRRSVGDIVPTMSASLRAQLRATPVVPITARQASRSALYKVGAVAAAVLAVVGLGVGATQNRLPSGLQDVLSSTADIIGVHVPAASERADDPGKSGSSNGNDDGVPGGGNDNTNGGATPADPGTPGDQAPATPATPPEQSNGTPGDSGTSTPNEHSDRGTDSIGDTNPPPEVTAPVPPSTVPPPAPEPEAPPVTEPEQDGNGNGNGNGNGSDGAGANTNASANGQANSTNATGAQAAANGNAAGTDNGGGPPPDTTLRAAGHGPPPEVLAG